MNKQELYDKWGKYTNTDKLVDDIAALLTEYEHRNDEHGICVMLDKYFTNKERLIKLFQKSKNYVGDMRIVIRKDFERTIEKNKVYDFCRTFYNDVKAEDAIIKYTDEDGKTFRDYLSTGPKLYKIDQLTTQSHIDAIQNTKEKLSRFGCGGMTIASMNKGQDLRTYLRRFGNIYSSTISETDKGNLDAVGKVKIATGMKTSRAFNRVCNDYGICSLPKYNSLFAEYSDMVSTNTRALDFVISLNPYDYLTMSFGKSWASCHTIDKTNRRRSADSHYHGMYCGGTLSYMLDESSIISFVIDKDGDPQKCGKIYRNMFHYQNYTLVQGRIYPQGNDGATNLYDDFRAVMQAELASMHDIKNMWTIKRGTRDCRENTTSVGVHYRDYEYNSNCNVCYPTEFKDSHGRVNIGSVGVCPNCGREINLSGYLSHSDC